MVAYWLWSISTFKLYLADEMLGLVKRRGTRPARLAWAGFPRRASAVDESSSRTDEDSIAKRQAQSETILKRRALEHCAVNPLVPAAKPGCCPGGNAPVTKPAIEMQRIQIVLQMTSQGHAWVMDQFNLAHKQSVAKTVPGRTSKSRQCLLSQSVQTGVKYARNFDLSSGFIYSCYH